MQRIALALLLLLGGCWEVSAQGSKPSFITREALELRLKALERDRNQAIANVNAYDGAIQECNFWIELLKDAEQEETMNEFPKVKYHRDHDPVTVKSAEEEEALGKGWFDNPGLKSEKPSAPVVEPEAAPPSEEEAEPDALELGAALRSREKAIEAKKKPK